MTTTKKLKLWTIITHAFIVVGFGHGILTLGLLEIIYLPLFEHKSFSFRPDSPFQSRLPVIVILTFLGQLSLTHSIFSKQASWTLASHLLGLSFLWLSIMYFTRPSREFDVHFATITAIPFFLCTILVFVTHPLRRLYKWAIDE